VKRVLTPFRKTIGISSSLLLGLAFQNLAFAQLPAQPAPQNLAPVRSVPVREQSFENRREDASRLTWKLHKIVYADGVSVLTLAGLQFEEALGLSVVVVDPPPLELFSPISFNAPAEPSNTQVGLSAPSATTVPPTINDIPSDFDARLAGEAARADLQIRNLLVPLDELKNKDSLISKNLPACAQGQRRAVAFIRAHQVARSLEVSRERAETLSKFGRAACVKWNGFPDASKTTQN
jgi:hypothetical protein